MGMPHIVTLAYHAVSQTWPFAFAISLERLEAQLRFLLRHGYTGATLSEARRTPSRKTLVVTFDDAYRSMFDRAFPLLTRLELRGTVFIPTNHVEAGTPLDWPRVDAWLGTEHEHELLPMSWEQLGELAEAGWEIGSHGCSHVRLTSLEDTALARELADSRRICEERLRRACRSFAYPYGVHDEGVVAGTRAAGYGLACTVPHCMAADDPLRWPRIGIRRDESEWRFRAKVSPAVTAVLGSAPLARGARGGPRGRRRPPPPRGAGPPARVGAPPPAPG